MADNTDGTVQERFSEAVKAWKSSAGRRSAAQKGAQTRRNRKEDAERRAIVRQQMQEEREQAANKRTEASSKAFKEKFGKSATTKIPRKRDRLPRAAKGDGWDY
eukprot:COSAG05_NODE_1157_length_5683_cov_2.960064_5_plen_104_part_00